MSLKVLGIETDKNENELVIYHSPTLTLSPVYPSFLRGLADVIEKGHRDAYKKWDDNLCGAVYAECNKQIVGHIVYFRTIDENMLIITEASVEVDWRRQGVYTLLFKHLEQVAKEQKFMAISVNIKMTNEIAIECAAKTGMSHIGYMMLKKL